jgi:copper chaperone CopZ
MKAIALVLVTLALPAFAVSAERTQVFSIQGADCATCGDKIKAELKKVKGVKKVEFDRQTVELTVRLVDSVADDVVVSAVERAGFKALVGAGQGAYLPHPDYPAGADVATLTTDGSAVGPLEKRRVAGKYTVFDVYADWCGPCRLVDDRLRELQAARQDIAVRKLNVVDFETPLARELGAEFDTLPYVIVFSPQGKKTVIVGADFEKLDKALSKP